MPFFIFDNADEFRIEISGLFSGLAVNDAVNAWTAGLKTNTPRRISVDITKMTDYDEPGYQFLREVYAHGTHVVAGTPKSLQFLNEISSPARTSTQKTKRNTASNLLLFPRARAAGE